MRPERRRPPTDPYVRVERPVTFPLVVTTTAAGPPGTPAMPANGASTATVADDVVRPSAATAPVAVAPKRTCGGGGGTVTCKPSERVPTPPAESVTRSTKVVEPTDGARPCRSPVEESR